MTTDIKIDTITQGNWEAYRDIRLASLQDAPEAYCSTYEREAAFTENEWKARLLPMGDTLHILPIMAKYKDLNAGVASIVIDKKTPNKATIYQMWVSPDCRGQGVGQALMRYMISWAKEQQLTQLELAVTTTNLAAISLYKSIGFIDFGKQEPLRDDPPLFIQSMRLELN
ncbi:GNAT family N-acetyltransferase [Leucothrix sargassi]|nr:GNAT family N-acetyltransferase [Leucothrix sargassi]